VLLVATSGIAVVQPLGHQEAQATHRKVKTMPTHAPLFHMRVGKAE
jgi:hypothetical protein